MKDKKSLFTAVSILIGTVIGAGFLGIPSVVSRAGFAIGVFYLLFIFLIMLIMNLLLGEIILRTKGHHQLTGYSYRYLGRRGRKIMAFSQIFGIYSALLAYLLAISTSLNFLIMENAEYSLAFGFLMWIVFSFIVSFRINSIRKSLGYGTLGILILIFLIAFIKFPQINYENFQGIELKNIFLPFGVVLFSFLGFSAMPEIEEYLHGKEKFMKKVLIIGTLVPLIVYFIFTFLIVGVYGKAIPEVATLTMGVTVILLGILTMSNAYIALSAALQDMYVFDFFMSRKKSWFFVILIPFALFVLLNIFKFGSFITIISVGGTVSGGLTALLILLMTSRAKKFGDRKPEYSLNIWKGILFLIGMVFILGIFYEILIILGIL